MTYFQSLFILGTVPHLGTVPFTMTSVIQNEATSDVVERRIQRLDQTYHGALQKHIPTFTYTLIYYSNILWDLLFLKPL